LAWGCGPAEHRRCRSPLCWLEAGERSWCQLPIVQATTDKIVTIKEKLKAARDRQKSYADKRRKPLEFEVGDRVLLKVSPWKGTIRFGKRGKLNPRYIGPFEIIQRIGPVAYKLDLPPELGNVHNTFHVSNLKKCLAHVPEIIPVADVRVDDKLQIVNEPIAILDRDSKRTRHSRIPIVKVQWNSTHGPEFTWEREDYMQDCDNRHRNRFSGCTYCLDLDLYCLFRLLIMCTCTLLWTYCWNLFY